MNNPLTNWALDEIEKNLDAGRRTRPEAYRYDLRFQSWTDKDTEKIHLATANAQMVLSRWWVDTRDKAVRDGLIELGWTPPPAP